MKNNTFPEPDYAFWDTVYDFPEWHVICLWCDMEPTHEAGFCVKAQVIQKKLTRARMAHALNSYVEQIDYPNGKSNYEICYHRDDLKDYALKICPERRAGSSPAFAARSLMIKATDCGASRCGSNCS